MYCPNSNSRSVSILLPHPNSFFAQNISFRMFSSLEFSYVVYMVINLITAKSGVILKSNKGKNIHLNLWNFGTSMKKNNVRNPQPFSQTLTDYGRVQWTLISWFLEYFMSYFNLLLHNYMKKILLSMPKLQCAHKQYQNT